MLNRRCYRRDPSHILLNEPYSSKQLCYLPWKGGNSSVQVDQLTDGAGATLCNMSENDTEQHGYTVHNNIPCTRELCKF